MPSGIKDKSLKKKYRSSFSNRRDIPDPEQEPENNVEGIYPSLKEFKNSLKETDPVLRNMNMNVLQKLNEDRDRSKLSRRWKSKSKSINKAREEPKKAPILFIEDNLTKAKRSLMAPKQLCPTRSNIWSIEMKINNGEKDEEALTKLREALIKKRRDYHSLFPKYNGNSKQGQTWVANICYHVVDYRLDTIAAEDVKFAIQGTIETTMRTRVLHLEPGKIGFNSFTPAEYLEEMLGRFMNARTKGGTKEEFKQKKQGVNEDTLKYHDTKLQIYLHAYDEGD